MVTKRQEPDREPDRIAIPMPTKLIERIDEYRWNERAPSRAAAIRALIEIGLRHHGKSSRSSSKDSSS